MIPFCKKDNTSLDTYIENKVKEILAENNCAKELFRITNSSWNHTFTEPLGEGHYQLHFKGFYSRNAFVRLNGATSGALFNGVHMLRNTDETVSIKGWSPTTVNEGAFPFTGWNNDRTTYRHEVIFDIYVRGNRIVTNCHTFAYDNNHLIPTFQFIMMGVIEGSQITKIDITAPDPYVTGDLCIMKQLPF